MTIVAFSGRLKSGKTTLAQSFINNGFTKVSFADALKESLIEVYELDRNSLHDQDLKNKILEEPYYYDLDHAKKLASYFKLEVSDIWSSSDYRELVSIRDMMQYIGTDILRRYEYNFHVKKTLEKLEFNKNYVFDDVRFNNEKTALDTIGAKSTFVIRPMLMNYSNHRSEIDLVHSSYENVIINDGSYEDLSKKSSELYESIINKTFQPKREKWNLNLKTLCDHMGTLSPYFYPVLDFLKLEDGKIKIKQNPFVHFSKVYGFDDEITCPYFIEELKLLNISFDDNGDCYYDYPEVKQRSWLSQKNFVKGLMTYSDSLFIRGNDSKNIIIKVPDRANNKDQVIDYISNEFAKFSPIAKDDCVIIPSSMVGRFLEYVI